MDIGIRILIIFMLILMSGFFAMSEAAIFAACKSRLQHRANEGDPQTSSGLLLAVTVSKRDAFLKRAKEIDLPVWVIGEVVEGEGIDVV